MKPACDAVEIAASHAECNRGLNLAAVTFDVNATVLPRQAAQPVVGYGCERS